MFANYDYALDVISTFYINLCKPITLPVLLLEALRMLEFLYVKLYHYQIHYQKNLVKDWVFRKSLRFGCLALDCVLTGEGDKDPLKFLQLGWLFGVTNFPKKENVVIKYWCYQVLNLFLHYESREVLINYHLAIQRFNAKIPKKRKKIGAKKRKRWDFRILLYLISKTFILKLLELSTKGSPMQINFP